MFIDRNSLIVDGINLGNYIVEAKFGYNKLWGSDSGRNLAGTMSGTLQGNFPKIIVTFRKLSRQELELLAPILDKANQQLTYYDPVLRKLNTITTYTGDWEVVNRNTFTNVAKANESFDISFIAVKAR